VSTPKEKAVKSTKTNRWSKTDSDGKVWYQYGDRPGSDWKRAGYWQDGMVVTDEEYVVIERWDRGYKSG
jgi:hypothetical protein